MTPSLQSRHPHDVTEVTKAGLCTGCGLCASLAGPDKIRMGLNIQGNMRPQVIGEVDAETNRTIMATCPGAVVTGPGQPDGVTTHPIWGPIKSIHRSWSAEPDVRHHAAAGGTMTGLGRYLLDSGKVSAIVHVRASTSSPWLTDAYVSRTADEVMAGAQSRYGPAAPLLHVKRLLDEGETFAVLAKPCDISAMRALAQVDPRVEKQVPYLITNFCGGIFSGHVARSMVRYHGVEDDDVATFGFRGDGWPGPHRVQTKQGVNHDIAYADAYKDKPWGYDLQFRCKICPDAVGEVADLSLPDGWKLRDGRPVHDEAPGENVAVVRTERGSDLLRDAVAAGYLELDAVTMDELEAMHANHPDRKVGTPGTFLALRVAQQLSPTVSGYRPWRSARRAGYRVLRKQFLGTLRRVIRGNNREAAI
jgi:coenzyme F420 hydrogenase subunit beta